MIRLLLFLCFVTSAFAQSNYSSLAIPAQLKKNANSVVLNENIEIDLSKKGQMRVKTHQVTAVFNKYGDRSINTASYYDEGKRVKNIEIYIYDAFGKEIEHYKKKDFKDVSVADGFSLFSDNRALYLDYTPTEYPYTLEFISETESNGNAFISPWFPVKSYVTGVLKSERKIIYSPENKLKYKSKNLEGYGITIQDNPNEFIASVENITPIKYEEHAPPFKSLMPNISFALDSFYLKGAPGNGTDWEQFGVWMNNSLLADVSLLPEGTIAKVKALVANETTNEGKARKIYQFVQDKVRYISVQIGIGGWKPMLASDVDALGYGDCKALTNYTKALLDAVGVPSYYTILYAGQEEQDIQSDFTSMQGNHVILGVPNEDTITWLECTSQDTPYGFIGNFTDDRDVVMITPEGGKIMHTKIYPLEENVQETTSKITIANDGSINAILKRVSKGLQYDDVYHLESKNQDELKKKYKEEWSYINGLAVVRVALDNDKEQIIFTENMEIKAPNYMRKAGEEWLLPINVFSQSQYVPPRIIDRKQQLFISESFSEIDTYELVVDANYTIEALPEAKIIKNEFGLYSILAEKKGENTVVFTRKFQLNKGTFSIEHYNKYRAFRRTIGKLDKTKILIKPKA